MKFLLVRNPASRGGKARRVWSVWEQALKQAGVDVEYFDTRGIGDALGVVRRSHGVDTIVAVGGDGTINEVLDGIMQRHTPRPAMGVLYAGTSPDFCRFHRIPLEPEAAVATLLAGRARKVDVARITFHSADGVPATGHFGCSCNVGLGAAIARRANRWRPFLGDALGTGAAVVRALLTEEPADLTLCIDAETRRLHRVNNLSIVKNPYLASGLKLRLDRTPDDGWLTAFALHGRSRAGLCRALPAFYSGRITEASSGVFRTDARSLRVASDTAVEVEFDGDPRGYLPIDIEILPGALTLIGSH